MSAQPQALSTGDLPSQFFERGLLFASGRAGEVDLIEAHKWFNIAASRGDRVAALHREELASEMSPEAIASALKAAREWKLRH